MGRNRAETETGHLSAGRDASPSKVRKLEISLRIFLASYSCSGPELRNADVFTRKSALGAAGW